MCVCCGVMICCIENFELSVCEFVVVLCVECDVEYVVCVCVCVKDGFDVVCVVCGVFVGVDVCE